MKQKYFITLWIPLKRDMCYQMNMIRNKLLSFTKHFSYSMYFITYPYSERPASDICNSQCYLLWFSDDMWRWEVIFMRSEVMCERSGVTAPPWWYSWFDLRCTHRKQIRTHTTATGPSTTPNTLIFFLSSNYTRLGPHYEYCLW